MFSRMLKHCNMLEIASLFFPIICLWNFMSQYDFSVLCMFGILFYFSWALRKGCTPSVTVKSSLFYLPSHLMRSVFLDGFLLRFYWGRIWIHSWTWKEHDIVFLKSTTTHGVKLTAQNYGPINWGHCRGGQRSHKN